MNLFTRALKHLHDRLFGEGIGSEPSQVQMARSEPIIPESGFNCVECDAPYGSPHERGCTRAVTGASVVVAADVEGEVPLAAQYTAEAIVPPATEEELDRLPIRERAVLEWLHGLTGTRRQTYGEVADRYSGVSEFRVRMVEDEAMKRLLSMRGQRDHDPVLGPETGGDRQVHGKSRLPSGEDNGD